MSKPIVFIEVEDPRAALRVHCEAQPDHAGFADRELGLARCVFCDLRWATPETAARFKPRTPG